LRAGSLILLEPGDRQEIRARGRADLKTVRICPPPAYSQSGQELAGARSKKGPTIAAAEVDQVYDQAARAPMRS